MSFIIDIAYSFASAIKRYSTTFVSIIYYVLQTSICFKLLPTIGYSINGSRIEQDLLTIQILYTVFSSVVILLFFTYSQESLSIFTFFQALIIPSECVCFFLAVSVISVFSKVFFVIGTFFIIWYFWRNIFADLDGRGSLKDLIALICISLTLALIIFGGTAIATRQLMITPNNPSVNFSACSYKPPNNSECWELWDQNDKELYYLSAENYSKIDDEHRIKVLGRLLSYELARFGIIGKQYTLTVVDNTDDLAMGSFNKNTDTVSIRSDVLSNRYNAIVVIFHEAKHIEQAAIIDGLIENTLSDEQYEELCFNWENYISGGSWDIEKYYSFYDQYWAYRNQYIELDAEEFSYALFNSLNVFLDRVSETKQDEVMFR